MTGLARLLLGGLALGLFAPAPARAACDTGGIAWVRRLFSPIDAEFTITATPDGGVAALGSFRQALRFDDGGPAPRELLGNSKDATNVLVKLTSSGALEWLVRLTPTEKVTALLVSKDGTIVVAGSARGPIGLEARPGGRQISVPGDPRVSRLFLGFYEPTGNPRSVAIVAQSPPDKNPTTNPPANIRKLVAAGDGIAIAGSFEKELTFGADARGKKLVSRGQQDAFLAVLRADRSVAWTVRAGGEGGDWPGPLAVLPDGSFAMGGRFGARDGVKRAGGPNEGATFGEGRAFQIRAEGLWDTFLVRVSGDGRVLWAQAVGGNEEVKDEPGLPFWPHPERLESIVAGADGAIVVTGVSPLPMRFGRERTSLGTRGFLWQSYLARLSLDGKLRSAIALGGEVDAKAVLPGGDLLVAGKMDDELRYPGVGAERTTLFAEGRDDALIARHGPDGALRWAARLGGRGDDTIWEATADAAGAVTLTARFEKDFAIGPDGCRPMKVAPGRGPYLIRLAAGAKPADEARTRRLVEANARVKTARAAATRAFKAKRYADACPLYQQVVDLAPRDHAARTDLGLCLQRLGRTEEAIAANRQAIVLAAPEGGHDDSAAEATRSHAYYNLAKLGEKVQFPQAACGALPPAPGCGKPVWICKKEGRTGGSGGTSDWTTGRVAVTKEDAEIEKDEDPRPLMPSQGQWGEGSEEAWSGQHNTGNRAKAVDLLLDMTEESFCHDNAGPECGDSDGTIDCNIVYADACLGLVGTACTNTRRKAKLTVDEFYLYPAR